MKAFDAPPADGDRGFGLLAAQVDTAAAGAYNIASGQPVSPRDVTAAIAAEPGCGVPVRFGAREPQPGGPPGLVAGQPPQESTRMSGTTPLHLYRTMLYIRMAEERIAALYPEQEMRCPTHFSIGQEAIAAGVCAALGPRDYVLSAHRSHAHYLAKGGNLRAMMAELYGKDTGCARGKGGSMHLVDRSVGFLGCVPIVGSTIPIGVGAAFGARQRGETDRVTAIFFGDGAAETGVFHESINFAAVHRLPILFVCENNFYSVNTPMGPRQPEGRTITDIVRGHGLPAERADGQEVEPVAALAAAAIGRLRAGGGPEFLELETYRWLEHCGPASDIALGYRPAEEFEAWRRRDPVALHRDALRAAGVLDDALEAQLREDIGRVVDAAVAFAKDSPFPERSELLANVYPTQASR
ncbi:thiamine pyrophosphate-dependent dehydrogenase E1 component subunit alpha [Azospirillum sp.]|uniref:thiamine pyrophosphate-dependent dehydrogenase E1 component subunit alpha n=1 Tax=Azospirillum sp. TaxID=34012 RepID=UPI002D277FAA|nr:thiamine pyrophosphate-dependent dehydrogenase E1 component subunit alpha [Azospirillum sp.]HYD71399.1 thiamine pyrophosphate-dependent dehydrogenase E1 component subunit alpha [Azospirillum sp.]